MCSRARCVKAGCSISDLEHAREVADTAEMGASALHGMGDATVVADEIFGFHAQQAAEKLLEVGPAPQGETYPLSRDLAALLDILSAGGADIALSVGCRSTPPTPFACMTRLPLAAPCRAADCPKWGIFRHFRLAKACPACVHS